VIVVPLIDTIILSLAKILFVKIMMQIIATKNRSLKYDRLSFLIMNLITSFISLKFQILNNVEVFRKFVNFSYLLYDVGCNATFLRALHLFLYFNIDTRSLFIYRFGIIY